MKKIFSLFLWFCAATMIAQIAIVSLSTFRGNLTKQSWLQIAALLNGIDIPGERLKNALSASRDIPVPTREEIIAAKIQSNLELDSREKSLERWGRQLQTEQSRLQVEDERLTSRVKAFEIERDQFQSGRVSAALAEVQKIIETISPEQAKSQLVKMIENNSMEDVIAIVKGLPEDKRKKILGEFTSPEDSAQLSVILRNLRDLDSQSKEVSTPTDPQSIPSA